MSIRVSGPNGETFEFPDGTSPQVIQSALQGHYAEQARQSERTMSIADMAGAAATGPLGILAEAGKRYIRGRAESGEAEADYKRDDGFLDRAGSLLERGTQSAMGGANRVAGAITGNVAVTNRARTLEDASNAEIAGTTSWEDVKNADGVGSMIANAAKFGLETGIQSLPEMLITAVPGVGLATETAIQAGRIGQQRAQNNGETDATTGDVLKAAPFAAASTFLEKLGIGGVAGKFGSSAAGRIASGTVTEAGTEFLQSVIENAGGTALTKRGFDVREAAEQGIAGAIGGAVMGGTIAAGVETGRQTVRRIGTKPVPAGEVEASANDAAIVTADDEASPIPTDLIAEGKAIVGAGEGASRADQILSQAGLPTVSTPVEITLPGGKTIKGTVSDAFQTDAGEFGQSSGVKIALEDGTTFAEHFEDIADAGVTIRPVNQTVEEINADIKARADQAEAEAQKAMEAYQASAVAEADILPPAKNTEAEIDDRTPIVSQPVDQAVADFKARARRAESGGNDNAKNPRSSAAGRYQFTNGTWLATYKAEIGNTGESDAQILAKKTDAGLQERLMDRLTRDNARELERIGVPINSATLYTAHFAGIGGAKKLYTADKDESVEAVLGAAVVKANPFLRGMTVGQAIDDLARRIGSKAPAAPTVAGETPSPTPQEEGPNPFEKALADYQREEEEAAAREAAQQPSSPEILAPLTPEATRETEDVTPGAVAALSSPGDVAEAGGVRPVDGGQPAEPSPLRALIDSKKSQDVRGDPIDKEWTRFKPESGTLSIPRDEMPQIKAENRGAMVNFLNARGVQHSEGTIAATDLKPTQQEFSEAKVQKARDYEGGNRAILVSRDGHVLDGHHQWMAARDAGENIRAIVLDAPIRDLINTVRDMPSVETATGEDVPEVQPASTAERPAAVGEPTPTAEVSPGTTAAADFAPPQQPAAAVRPPIATVPQSQPTEDVAITPTGREIPVNYAVVDLKNLVTSHTQDGAINPEFPAALQPRDRTRDDSTAQIAEIAAKLDPRLLGKSVKASDGAPIISPVGIVESGNGRTLALGRAYQLGGEKIEAYRQFIKDQGFNVEGVDQPVLVRVRGDMGAADVEAFTREANQRDTAGFSATEQAVSDAAALPGSMLDLYRGGDIDTAGNREFVRKFMEAVVPTNERANMISADGAVSQDAMRRIGAALLQRAYGNEQLVAKLNEATDSNIKSIGGALADVSAAWAKMREAASEGRIDPAMDITANLNEAVEIVDRARREGVKVADLVNQRDIFSGQTVDPMTEAVLRLMFRNPSFTQPYSRQKLAEQLGWYVDEAMKTSAGEDLFGGATKPTPGAILALAGDKFGEQQTTQESLFGRSQQADAGDGGGVRQDGRAGERAGEGVSEQRREEGGAEGEWVEPAQGDQEPKPQNSAAPKPEKPAQSNVGQKPIEDFGAKLEGARKDVWQDYSDRLKRAETIDIKSEPLSKSWPEPDYQKLLDDGADPYIVASMRAMRDAVPTKPRSYGVVGWAQQVEALRNVAMKMLDDGGVAESFMQKLQGEFSRSLRDLQGSIDLYREFGHERSFKGISFGSRFYSLYRGEQNVTKWSIEQKQKATAFSNWPRELAVGDTREEVLAKFAVALASGALDPKAKARNEIVRFDIYSRRGQPGFIIGKKIGKEHVDLKRFDTAKEARDFKVSDEGYAELVAALDKFKDIPPERREVNSPRIGINHRNGADVTPEMFADAFGFRGVQFGNYVESARRQTDLNQAYDALMDLAGIIGVPPKALSLNGGLGLAFGARGKGGKGAFSAHYEPDTVVINLTKNAGAGSLAHEWWHSLDNYFSRMRNDPTSYLTDKAYERGDGVRPEMVQAFASVMAAIKSTGLRERSRNLDKRRTKDYWSTNIEMSARAFESYVIAKLQDEQFSNDYLANIVSEKAFSLEGGYPYLTAAEVPAVRAAFDEFFRTAETENTASGVRLFSRYDGQAITLTGNELGDSTDILDLQRRARQWYKSELRLKSVTSSDGAEVRFTRVGEGKIIGGQRILRAVPAIPAIIERGVHTGPIAPSEKWAARGAVAAHSYVADVTIAGETQSFGVLVQEFADGRRFYSLTDQPSEAVGSRLSLAEGQSETGARVEIAPDTLNLYLGDPNFNIDRGGGIDATVERENAVWDRLADRLDKMNVDERVRLSVQTWIDLRGRVAGQFGTIGNGEAVIRVAMNNGAQTPEMTLDHEVVHALKWLGNFKDTEWTRLSKDALADTEMMASIRRRYPDYDETAQIEEAIADRYMKWRAGQEEKGFVRAAFERVREFFRALGQLLRREGFTTSEAVFRAIARGDVGGRNVGEPQPINGDGTYNYVLFDDSRAKVISKYSITDAPFERTADDSPGGISQPQTNAIIAGMGDGSKWDAIRDKIDDWRIIVQDKMLPVLRQQEAVARSLGRKLAESENPYLAEELMTGKVGAQLEVLSEEMIDPLFQAMHENGVTVDELETYAYAQHAPERNAQIVKINPEFTEGTGSGMTDTQASAILKRAERAGKADVLNALANQMRAILQEAKRIRVEAGLLSEEEAAAWDSTYEFYVPLRGRAEVDGDASRAKDRVRTQSGMSVRGKESKRAFGRKSQADNILAYTILQAEEAIVRAEKNRVAQSFLRLASASPNPDFWEVNKVRRVPVMDKTSGLVRYELQTRLAAEDADYTVVAKVNGDEMRVTLNRDNPQAVKVAEAMRNLDAPKFNRVMAAAATFNRYFSAINTRYNPSFVITNALRDLQTMAVVSQQFDLPNFAMRVVRDYFPAMLASKRGDGEWSKWRREWELAGGKVYYNQAGDLDQIRKDIETRSKRLASPNFAAKAWVKTFDALEAMNDSVERAVRLAVYKNARELGKTKSDAASMARNVTVNFTRKGKIGPAMNAFYAFFNASTQGSANLILAGVRSKKVRTAMAGFIIAGFLADMLNSMISGDDDDGESYWDKMPDFEKSRNIIFMLPGAENGRAIKFPIAWGLNALFGLGRHASAMMRGAVQPGEAALSSAIEFFDAFNPIGNGGVWQNILAPTALDPIIDISENKDFAGKPIQPEQNPFEPPVTPSSNYFPSASAWAKSITQAINSATGGDEVLPGAASVSPEVLEYLAGYITGGAGRFVNDFANVVTAPGDPEAELTIRDVPIAKTLVTQKSPWIDKTLYYQRVREVEATLDHAKQYKERGDIEALARFAEEKVAIGQMEGVTKEASKLMREVRKARNEASFAHELGRIDDATYRDQISRVKEAESRIVSAYNARWTATMEAAGQ